MQLASTVAWYKKHMSIKQKIEVQIYVITFINMQFLEFHQIVINILQISVHSCNLIQKLDFGQLILYSVCIVEDFKSPIW